MALLRELEFGGKLEGTTLPPPRVYDHRVSKSAMDRFLVFLARCNNPDTNKRYTFSELTKDFQLILILAWVVLVLNQS